MVTRKRVPRREQPSIRAAFSSETGTSRKKLRSSQMISGSQKATLTITRAATVSVRPTIWKTRRTGMAMTIAGHHLDEDEEGEDRALAGDVVTRQGVGRRRGEDDHEDRGQHRDLQADDQRSEPARIAGDGLVAIQPEVEGQVGRQRGEGLGRLQAGDDHPGDRRHEEEEQTRARRWQSRRESPSVAAGSGCAVLPRPHPRRSPAAPSSILRRAAARSAGWRRHPRPRRPAPTTGARRRSRAIRIRKLHATMIRNRMTVIAAP